MWVIWQGHAHPKPTRKQYRNSCLFCFLKIGLFLPSSEHLDSGRRQKRNIVTVKHRSACEVEVKVCTSVGDKGLLTPQVFCRLEYREASAHLVEALSSPLSSEAGSRRGGSNPVCVSNPSEARSPWQVGL